MKYLFSVIIPIYNGEMYIDRCLNSILNACQNRDGIVEIILVNDGSTDRSLMKCKKFAESYEFIYVYHQENLGVSTARNIGLDHARGKYILFIDIDDYIDERYFEVIMKQVISDDELYIFNHNLVTELNIKKQNLRLEYKDYKLNNFNEVIESLIFQQIGALWDKVFLADIISKYTIRFRRDISISEDMVFISDYIKRISKIKAVDEAVYYYVCNKDSAVHHIKTKYFYDRCKVYAYSVEMAKKYEIDNSKIELMNEYYLDDFFMMIARYYRREQAFYNIIKQMEVQEEYQKVLNYKYRLSKHILKKSILKNRYYKICSLLSKNTNYR